MNVHDWSLQKAIEERVKLEDIVAWAERVDTLNVAPAPLPSTKHIKRFSLLNRLLP